MFRALNLHWKIVPQSLWRKTLETDWGSDTRRQEIRLMPKPRPGAHHTRRREDHHLLRREEHGYL